MRTSETVEQVADLVIDVLVQPYGVRDALPECGAISTAQAMHRYLDSGDFHPEIVCRVSVRSGILLYGQKSAEAIEETLASSGHVFLAHAFEDAGQKGQRPLAIVEMLGSF